MISAAGVRCGRSAHLAQRVHHGDADLNDEGHDEWLWASEQLLSALPEPRRVTLVAQEHQGPTVASTVQPFYDSANHDQDVRLALAALSP